MASASAPETRGRRLMHGFALVVAEAVHPAALAAVQHPIPLRYAMGTVVVIFGLLAAVAGSALRWRALMAAALVTALTGVLSMAKPDNPTLLAVALVATIGIAVALAARATAWARRAPRGRPRRDRAAAFLPRPDAHVLLRWERPEELAVQSGWSRQLPGPMGSCGGGRGPSRPEGGAGRGSA